MLLRRKRIAVPALVGLCLTLLFAAAPWASAATVPAGFDDQQVAVVAVPTSVAFGPGSRMLITSQTGALRLYRNGSLLATPAINLEPVTCSNSERGLLGVAFDPAFATNGFIYVYYTYNKFGTCDMSGPNTPVNRVSRFVLGENDIVDPASEMVLIDNIPSPTGIHNAGDLNFGKDGNLYVSVGEGGCDWRGDSGCGLLNNAARDLGGLPGKILRITRDGAIPPGNPYTGANTDRCNVLGNTMSNRKCQEIYAWGLRNPFRMGFDVNSPDTRFYINDVGEAKWDEIDVGEAGADYGWNVREGHCLPDSYTDCPPPPVGMTDPIYDYDHSSCSAITAGDFVPAGIWPSEYDGAYLYGDLVCGKMFRLDSNGSGGYTATEFASGMHPLIDGVFGPYGTGQALYYVTWQGWPNGQVRRISYTGGANRAPTARADADQTAGALPLDVTFDGNSSTDPDGDSLSYEWDFGDGSPIANGSTLSHTYTTDGTYTATLTVRDPDGEQNSSTVRIDAGNNVPVPTIDVPVTGQQFKVGEQVVLHGSATDPEDGALPDSALTWRVERHHNTHTHPFLPATSGNDIPITGPQPEDLWAAQTSYLEVFLTATDSEGRSTTVTRDIDPKKIDLSFDTIPTGLQLQLAGTTVTTPRTVTSWEGWDLVVNAPSPQNDSAGVPWRYAFWTDGGAQTHTITTPGSPASYAAGFGQVLYPRPGGATPLRVPLVPAFKQCTNPDSTHILPLAEASCTDVAIESSLLTTSRVGAGSGYARLGVIAGNPSTPADEADVAITSTASDIRLASDGSDYVGKVLLAMTLRITDKANASSGIGPGTVVDIPFGVPIDCVATASTSVGSNCNISTTTDTLMPGFAKEGKRAVISTTGLELRDAGPDASIAPASGACPPTCGSGDEAAVLRQGVFTP